MVLLTGPKTEPDRTPSPAHWGGGEEKEEKKKEKEGKKKKEW